MRIIDPDEIADSFAWLALVALVMFAIRNLARNTAIVAWIL